MATYAVTTTDSDWGEEGDQFKTRPEAERRMQQKVAAGHKKVRLVRWENGKAVKSETFPNKDTTRS
jgi:hypothetical protein